MRRALRAAAVVIAIHGALFVLGILAFGKTDNPALGDALFLLLTAPALALAVPLAPLLWALHLMEAPGWFAWPKPLGFVLVYSSWIAALSAASFIFRRRA